MRRRPRTRPGPRARAPRVVVRATLAVLLVTSAGMAHADTAGDLAAAKDRLAAAQAELDRVTARWQETETRALAAQEAVSLARQRIAGMETRLARLQSRLSDRARESFMSGGASAALGAVLGSETITDLTDRVRFASSVAQADFDLATEAAVSAEELRRTREQLAADAKAETELLAELDRDRADLDRKLSDLSSTVSELQAKYRDQQQAQKELQLPPSPAPGGGNPGTVPVGGSGAIQTCPVAGPNSFVDSFGWPRPGGRTHQGIDLISPFGTPIVAVHAGNAARTPNELGGNAVILNHDGGDWTYYAHMSSYGAAGHVAAGTVIGYVGSTGDTNVNHLHFEYHPGGGAAVDPYSMLVAVC